MKTSKTLADWQQPSEIHAAQQIEGKRLPLPERAALRHEDKTEFAVYSLSTLLSRIPFLLFVLLMLWGGVEFNQQWRLLWLAVLLFAAWRLAYHWHTLCKVSYNVQEDTLTVYRLRRFKWRPEKHYVLSEFCSIYCRKKYGGMGVKAGEIWLAGKEGGKDARLLEADFLSRDNRQVAEVTSKQISLATGLPLLEYAESAERIA